MAAPVVGGAHDLLAIMRPDDSFESFGRFWRLNDRSAGAEEPASSCFFFRDQLDKIVSLAASDLRHSAVIVGHLFGKWQTHNEEVPLPYVGCVVDVSAVATDSARSRQVLADAMRSLQAQGLEHIGAIVMHPFSMNEKETRRMMLEASPWSAVSEASPHKRFLLCQLVHSNNAEEFLLFERKMKNREPATKKRATNVKLSAYICTRHGQRTAMFVVYATAGQDGRRRTCTSPFVYPQADPSAAHEAFNSEGKQNGGLRSWMDTSEGKGHISVIVPTLQRSFRDVKLFKKAGLLFIQFQDRANDRACEIRFPDGFPTQKAVLITGNQQVSLSYEPRDSMARFCEAVTAECARRVSPAVPAAAPIRSEPNQVRSSPPPPQGRDLPVAIPPPYPPNRPLSPPAQLPGRDVPVAMIAAYPSQPAAVPAAVPRPQPQQDGSAAPPAVAALENADGLHRDFFEALQQGLPESLLLSVCYTTDQRELAVLIHIPPAAVFRLMLPLDPREGNSTLELWHVTSVPETRQTLRLPIPFGYTERCGAILAGQLGTIVPPAK